MRRSSGAVRIAVGALAASLLAGCAAGSSSATTVITVPPVSAECAAWTRLADLVAAVRTAVVAVAAVVELQAAPAVLAATDAIGASWPQSLVGERSTVLTDVVGPYRRRAEKAMSALAAAGLDAAAVAELRLGWDIDPARRSLPAHLREAVERAAQEFAAAVTPFTADPTLDLPVSPGPAGLVADGRAPATAAFLAACGSDG